MLELHDIQGLVLDGYGKLVAASYVLLSVGTVPNGPGVARRQRPRVAGHANRGAVSNVAYDERGSPGARGIDERDPRHVSRRISSRGWSTDFRSRVLGDVEASDPDAGSGAGRTILRCISCFFSTRPPIRARAALATAKSTRSVGSMRLTCVKRCETAASRLKEHFGFHDGISQAPSVVTAERERHSRRRVLARLSERIRQIYGGPQGSRRARPGPHPAAGRRHRRFRTNGSYLVFRQLGQDVYGFWKWLDENAGGDPRARGQIAAKMVGRWPGSVALCVIRYGTDHPNRPDNDFLYAKGRYVRQSLPSRLTHSSNQSARHPRKAKPGDLTLPTSIALSAAAALTARPPPPTCAREHPRRGPGHRRPRSSLPLPERQHRASVRVRAANVGNSREVRVLDATIPTRSSVLATSEQPVYASKKSPCGGVSSACRISSPCAAAAISSCPGSPPCRTWRRFPSEQKIRGGGPA